MNGVDKAAATTAITSASQIDTTVHNSPVNSLSENAPHAKNDIFIAAQYGDWQKIEHLIETGVAVATETNEQGTTALHWAAINDRLLACKTLLDHGAAVNAVGGDLQATPMMWAAKNGHVYIVHLLITYGGDPAMLDSQGYNVLQLATHSSNLMLILYLLHIDSPVESVDPQGHTSLMWAAYQGDALSVDAFLKWGADVNTRDHDGLNALHWSVVRGNKQCIKRVIEEGGDLVAKQNEGKDPRALAKELKTTKAFEGALESVGRDAESGLCRKQFFSAEMSMKLIFLLPILNIGIALQLFSRAPIVLSIPFSALVFFGCYRLNVSVITPPNLRSSGVHKTPYLAGIFFASSVWTTVHWLSAILPSIGFSHPILNFVFGSTFALCLYHFFMAMVIDPGFIPKNSGRTEQREAIEELIRAGEYDSQHFCIECLVRNPLRGKHCKICRRCVAKHDHHCPWVNNCVGIRNHRHFMIYIYTLFFGIPMYVWLTSLHIKHLGTPVDPVDCIVLGGQYCAWIQIDGFGTYLAGWDLLQMTWLTMLVVVQSWQITRATTTQEVMNIRRHGYMGSASDKRRVPVAAQIASVITAGTTDPDAAALNIPDCGHDHHHDRMHRGHGSGFMEKVARLLGIDQFVDTAKQGIVSARGRRRRKVDNPFDGGMVSNCTDFWSRPPRDAEVEGAGLLRKRVVNFYKLYEVPDTAAEMYTQLPGSEEV